MNKNIKISTAIILSTLSILCILGIASYFVITKYNINANLIPKVLNLSEEEMLGDYDTMWQILDENYPYMGVAERLTSKDFKEVKQSYRAKINGNISVDTFAEIIRDCLAQFEGTGHLNMLYEDDTYAFYLENYKNAASYAEHCKQIYNTMNNSTSKAFYHYKKSDTKEASKTQDITASQGKIATKEYNDIKTAYIKIPLFFNTDQNVPKLLDYFSKISDYHNCIIDIRGNGGGDDYYWMKGIVAPNLENDITLSYYFLTRGSLSKQYVTSEMQLQPIDQLNSSIFPNINLGDLADQKYYVRSDQEYKKAEAPLFGGDFYVLTDGSNYSSAESFVTFCKRSGFATLIGEPTGGDGMGIDPLVIALPNSGACFRFTTLYGLNEDGASNEEMGTQPDIDTTGKDALEVCLGLIKDK